MERITLYVDGMGRINLRDGAKFCGSTISLSEFDTKITVDKEDTELVIKGRTEVLGEIVQIELHDVINSDSVEIQESTEQE